MTFGEKQLEGFRREPARFVAAAPYRGDRVLEDRFADARQVVGEFRSIDDDALPDRHEVFLLQRRVQLGYARVEPLPRHAFGIADDFIDVP